MKLWILSDLHLEFGDLASPLIPPVADVCVVAGDVLTKGILPSIRWLEDNIAHRMPVVCVAGNHEFYRSSMLESLDGAATYRGTGRVHFLEDQAIEIEDTVFCGCTLWTDFDVLGKEWAELGMRSAISTMNDYRVIKFRKQPYARLAPVHTYQRHAHSRAFLKDCLTRYAGKTIVFVTHHAPSLASVEDRYRSDPLTTAFASNCENLMGDGGPRMWVHGHVHHRVDSTINNTRIVCNPRGYRGEPCHTAFDSALVVEV